MSRVRGGGGGLECMPCRIYCGQCERAFFANVAKSAIATWCVVGLGVAAIFWLALCTKVAHLQWRVVRDIAGLANDGLAGRGTIGRSFASNKCGFGVTGCTAGGKFAARQCRAPAFCRQGALVNSRWRSTTHSSKLAARAMAGALCPSAPDA